MVTETGRLDVVVHNAGHMALGPSEAFTIGTNHSANAGHAEDEATASASDELYPTCWSRWPSGWARSRPRTTAPTTCVNGGHRRG